jgi:outer membrane lipoprotein-sorting protein
VLLPRHADEERVKPVSRQNGNAAVTRRALMTGFGLALAGSSAAIAQPMPLPGGPPRPAGVAPAAPAAQPTAPAPAAQLSQQQIIDKLNGYLNSFQTLQGDFAQTGADGRRYEGKLYLHRPGRLRFEYKPPATIEIVADGTSVAVRDRKLGTQDLYLISQTPLKFLTKEKVDLARDLKVLRHSQAGDMVRMQLEDKATLGGTSRITLHYDTKADVLRQWTVVDPQGFETQVSIFNLDTQRRPAASLFAIEQQRVLPGVSNN